MRIEHVLSASAQRLPDKVALVCDGQRVSYGQLDVWANRLARSLIDGGVSPGDRVVLHVDNSVAAVVGMFATWRAGGVIVPLNPTMKSDKLAFILNNCRAKALIADARRLQVAADAVRRTSDLALVVVAGAVPASHALPESMRVMAIDDLLDERKGAANLPSPGIDADLAALVYTSGSTGTPKGVMLTHLNMWSAATSITTYLELTEDEVILNVLPLSFDYGLYQMLLAFKVGARLVLERSFTYPHSVLHLISSERVTGFPIVPTIVAILLRLNLPRYDFSSVRYMTNTGAALPTAHVATLREFLPGVRFFSMYGLTECKRVAYLPPEELDARPASVGKAIPNVEVYLVDDEGRRIDHGVGELVIRGSNVMRGYWELPEETARVLRPGPVPGQVVLHSGDVFRMDEEGYLYFVSRKDDVIKTRGEKVSPREVENVIHDLSGVVEAAVVGEPDPVLGQLVVAFVVAEPTRTLSAHDVLRHCAHHLEDFMIPKHVRFLDALPKTGSGKVDRRLLADWPLVG